MKSVAALVIIFVLVQGSYGFSARIVGGVNAARGQAPWHVLILRKDNQLKPFCAGSLISKEWVLTSAQCAHGDSPIVVVSGLNTMLSGSDDQGEGTNVQSPRSRILHPGYNPTGGGHDDIALLRLTVPLENTQYIRPIRLPRRSQAEHNFSASTVRVFGWGVTSDLDSGTNVLNRPLKMVDMSVISNEECEVSYGNYVRPSHLCTSGVTGGSICERDQGGALVIQETDGQWTQLGVASYFDSLSCLANHPSGFTRLTSYIDWILTNTGIARPEPEAADSIGQAAVGDVPCAVSIWAAVKNASYPDEEDVVIPFCTGALVSSNHVVVTGSCLDTMRAPEVPLVGLEAAAGAVTTANMAQGRLKVSSPTRYGPATLRDTIAVLKFSEKFNVNSTSTETVNRTSSDVVEGTICSLSGWKHYPEGEGVSGYLTSGKVTIRPLTECTPRAKDDYVTVCAQHVAGATEDPCVPPQEGGLVICDGQLTGLYSSMQDTTGHDCNSARHFLAVKQFNSWIDKQVNGGGNGAAVRATTAPVAVIALLASLSALLSRF